MNRRLFWPLAAILFGYVGLGVVYALTTPLFEKPDENWHFFTVLYLKEERRLPLVQPGVETTYRQEGAQAPLYYALAALALAPFNTSKAEELLWANPQANKGDPNNPGNRNVFVHPVLADPLLKEAARSVLAARLVSLLLGSGAILGTYGLIRQIAPARPELALATCGLVAFTPQWLFISSSVSNDATFAAFSSLSLWQAAAILRGGGQPRRLVLLGVFLGLAMLSKAGGLALAAICVVLVLLTSRRRLLAGTTLGALAYTFLPALAIALWWYVRNQIVYGDFTALSVLAEVDGGRQNPSWTASEALGEFRGLRWSYWGLFGWFSVLMPLWVYHVLDVLSVLALAGLALRAWRRPEERPGLALLLGWGVVGLLALIPWTLTTRASQGRLLFGQLSAFHALATLGVAELVGKRRWLNTVWPSGFVLLSAALPFAVIGPEYRVPPAVERGAIPPGALPLDLTFEGGIELLALEVEPVSVDPGEEITLTLYWRADRQQERDLLLNLRLLGRDHVPVAADSTYPGWGSWPTSLWEPGRIYLDRYQLPVALDAQTPALARWSVWFEDLETSAVLAPRGANRESLDILSGIAFTRLPPGPDTSKPQFSTEVVFGEFARLAGVSVEGSKLDLYWEVIRQASDNYNVFIHLFAPNGTRVAGADSPPFGGFYPTNVWIAGERMVDSHQLPSGLPPGEYKITIGLYRLEGGPRVSALEGGKVLEDASFRLPLTYRVPP